MLLVTCNRTVVEEDPAFTGDDQYIYTINSVRVYKTLPNIRLGQVLQFESFVASSLCGLYLEVGVEYVVGLDTNGSGFFAASCGPTRELASLTDEQLEVLENGGNCSDPCDEIVCTPFEVCSILGPDISPTHYC